MEEGALFLCTVDKIEGATVFVNLPNGEKGTIITSEIAPGRIRNLRYYVVPKKKIVCKVIRAKNGHIDLSLRRVTSKEKKEIMQVYKQEQTAKSAIHSILKDSALKAEENILKNFKSLSEFFIESRDNEKLVDKYIPKEYVEKIKKITQKKQRGVEVKKIVRLKCLEDDGVIKIKKIFSSKEIKATYISAGKFQISLKSTDYKKANHEIDKIAKNIEALSKKNSCEVSFEEIKTK